MTAKEQPEGVDEHPVTQVAAAQDGAMTEETVHYAPDPWLLKRLRQYYGLEDEETAEQE